MEPVTCFGQGFDPGHADALWATFKCVAQKFPHEIQLAQTIFSILFGLGGFAFGILRTWRYRENALFDRLKGFLDEEGAETEDATQDVFARLIQPSITHPGITGFDALWSLTQIRNRYRFVPLLALSATRTAAQQYLEASADALDRSQKNIGKFHTIALKRAVSARLLCSAVEASTAAGATDPQIKQLYAQLAHENVKLARQLPDCAHDPQALEIEIQLLLNNEDYQEASALAQKIIAPEPRVFYADDRSEINRDLCTGRAHRYQGIAKIASGNPGLASHCFNAALSKYRKHPHVRESHLLDFAHIAELRAACAKRLNAPQQQQKFSKLSEICYAKLRDTSDPWNRGIVAWISSRLGGDKFQTYLHAGAIAGLERLARLKAEPGYLPPPFKP